MGRCDERLGVLHYKREEKPQSCKGSKVRERQNADFKNYFGKVAGNLKDSYFGVRKHIKRGLELRFM